MLIIRLLKREQFLITRLIFLIAGLMQGFCAASASTFSDPPNLCVAASEFAAHQTGVPLSILIAITLTETGRNTERGLKPWPWAVNQDGEGYWFTTPNEAVLFVEHQLDLGLRNFDVGCFQINHRWHSKGFTSTTDMFNPKSNALYAAGFLAKLYADSGDWSAAAAAYHSRTPKEASRYKDKFDATLATLLRSDKFTSADAPHSTRINQFPLLQLGAAGMHGSLVPLHSTVARLIGGQP